MGIKEDKWIIERCWEGMITPFVEGQVRVDNGEKVISYGTSSYGYDIRCTNQFRIFTDIVRFDAKEPRIIDPKNFDPHTFVDYEGKVCIIPPNSFALTHSVERFKIPRNVTVVAVGKSTYARCGIYVGITPLEAGWEGYLTIEISNTTPVPAKVYANEGVAQLLFFEGDAPCLIAYNERTGGGKYNNQGAEPTPPKV